jgi:HSP20 family protein
MNKLDQALKEAKALHVQVFGRPAPALESQPLLPLPTGIEPFEFVFGEVENLKQISEGWKQSSGPATWIPPADFFSTKDELVVQLEIPGVSSEDLSVFVRGGECIVRGERKPPQKLSSMRPLSLERPWGPFERRFVLPVGGRTSEIKARVRVGILELRIPLEKGAVSEEHEIEVN